MALAKFRADEALRESEARFRSLFENMQEGFAYCRMVFEGGRPRDFIYLHVNEAFEKLDRPEERDRAQGHGGDPGHTGHRCGAV